MAITAAELQILLTARNQASSAVKQVKTDVEGMGKSTGAATKEMGGLNKALGVIAGGAAALGAVRMLQNISVQSYKAAVAAERLGVATDRLAGRMGESGKDMVAAIQQASNYTIDQYSAMTAANKAMMFGIIDSQDDMVELTNIAITLGAAMGQDAAKSVDDLTTALGRNSYLILDNLGITLKQTEAEQKYAEMLGKTTAALTDDEKAQAFRIAAMEKGREVVADLGGVTDTQASKVEALSAAWKDYLVPLGKSFVIIDQGLGLTEGITTWLRESAKDAEKAAEAWEKFFKSIHDEELVQLNKSLTETSIAAAINTGNIEDLVAAIDEAPGSLEDIQRALVANTGSMEDYDAIVAQLADATMGRLGVQLILTTEELIEYKDVAYDAMLATDAFGTETSDLYDLHDRLGAKIPEVTQAHRINSAVVAELKGRYREMGLELRDAEDVIDDNTLAEEALTKAIDDHEQAVKDLLGTQADYILGLQDANEAANKSASDYYASQANVTNTANENRLTAEEQLTTDLERLAQERAEKLHWVETGGQAKGAEQTETDYQYWAGIYDDKEQALRDSYQNEVAAINEGEAQKTSAIAAARAEELAREQAHREDLTLQAGLGVLESQGLLEQFTGVAGASASQVADMIRAGIIPLGTELQVALGQSLTGLNADQEAYAANAAASGQVISNLADGEYNALQMRTQTLKDAGIEMGDDVTAGLEGVGTAAGTATTGGLASMEEQLNTISTALDPAFEQMATGVSSIDDGIGEVVGNFETMVADIQEEIGDAGWDDLGEDVTDGLAAGIREGESNAVGAMEDVIRAMLIAAKKLIESGSPSKLFADEVGLPIAQGVLAGIDSLAPYDTKRTWDKFIRQNLADAFTALNDVPQFSKKIESNAEWLDFVDNLGYKEYWEQAWDEMANTLPLDTTMGDVYDKILNRTAELAGNSWSGAFQAVTSHLRPALEAQIADITDLTLAQFAGVSDERVAALWGAAGVLSATGTAAGTRYAEGFIAPLREELSALQGQLAEMDASASNQYSIIGQLSGVGGAASSRYQETVIGPMEEQLNTLNEQLDTMRQQGTTLEAEAAVKAEIAALEADIESSQARQAAINEQQRNMAYLQSQAELLQMISANGLDAGSILGGLQLGLDADAGMLMDAMAEAMQQMLSSANADLTVMQSSGGVLADRLTLTEQIAALEAEITSNLERQDELTRQQQDLSYLQSQANLMELISGYGLNASDILGGLALGIDADAGALMEAMTAALQQMVSAAEAELGIASPSKRFQEIGQQMMTGMALGIDKAAVFPQASAAQAAGGTTHNWNLTAQYGYQRPGSLSSDVRLLQMMSSRM